MADTETIRGYLDLLGCCAQDIARVATGTRRADGRLGDVQRARLGRVRDDLRRLAQRIDELLATR